MEHDRWVRERLTRGWIYGPTKSIQKKTHPYLVPWAKLSEEAKDLDRDAVRAIPALLARARYQVYRVGEKEPGYEILARAIHEEYVRERREKGDTPETNPSMVSWDELPEILKESNRSQAEDIRVKLKAIGCDIVRTTDRDAQLFRLSAAEVEKMAKMEHDRWVRERLARGWTYGTTKSVKKKTSPYLVPWDWLTKEVKDIDRNAVRAIPALLAKVGFQVYRVGEKQ